MKNMKAMKGRAKVAMSLLQGLHVLNGENTNVLFLLHFKSPPLLAVMLYQSILLVIVINMARDMNKSPLPINNAVFSRQMIMYNTE